MKKNDENAAHPTLALVPRLAGVKPPVFGGQRCRHGLERRHDNAPEFRGKDVVVLRASLNEQDEDGVK
jgi:hypothetical protein